MNGIHAGPLHAVFKKGVDQGNLDNSALTDDMKLLNRIPYRYSAGH